MTQPRQPPPAPHVRKSSPIPWVIFAVLVVVAGIVLVPKLFGNDSADDGPQPVAAAEQDPLLVAVQKCDPGKDGTKLSDSNRKLTIKGAGVKSPDGLSESAVTCVFDTLQVPGALADRMYGTVAADGKLQGDWPGFTAAWTNDQNEGLTVTVTRD
ncbi:hypothetical protein GCM10020358_51320 [Amorphoplanes nipponensis]|uniref:Uncharacterized protein n=1 Tax=Actinoplanes nipponensis TaxID=135950 RepID=A0A919JK99_9ACTN|nr:hypothetical protein [Actinoplanes nipponensis]GIE50890.1 hypothetical protein Ani05nite_44240 [Actinoplanes nipponensis]